MNVTITAPSGTGKTTLMRALIAESTVGMRLIPSTTTRAPRGTDLPLEYEYLSDTEFEALAEQGAFLKVYGKYGNYYGTRVSYFNDATFFKREPCLAAVLPEAMPLWIERSHQGLGAYRGVMCNLYLDLGDPAEHMRRLAERGETNSARLADDIVKWKEEALASNIPYHFLDARKNPYDLVHDVQKILAAM
jgi:thymidylate kinase